jgi:hypothetical protein
MPTWMSEIDVYTALAAAANIALAVLGALVAVYEKWTKKHRRAIVASFVLLGSIGFVAAIAAAAKSARDLKDANARVSATVDETRKAVLDTMTGGDSFCYAKLDPIAPTKPGKLNLIVIHHGKYALHDVTLLFYDAQKAQNTFMRSVANTGQPATQQETIAKSMRKTKLDELRPNHYLQIEFDYVPDQTNSHEYSISFEGPNGSWNELLRLQLVSDKWLQALKVTKEIPDPTGLLSPQKKTVLEDADDGFPK